MTSLSEDIVTPPSDLLDDAATDQSQDTELALDTALPELSPSISLSPVARPVGARLDPIVPPADDGTAKRKKKRKIVKKASVQLDTVSLPTWSKPLPPLSLETDSSSPRGLTPNEPSPPLIPIQSVLQVSYEPLRLISDEDLASHTETTLLGNPIATNAPPSQFLMKSERAYFERKDGRFISVSNQETPPPEPATHATCATMDTFSRASLAKTCTSLFNTLGLASHSLLVGLTLWQTVIAFTLASYTNLDLNLVMNLSNLSLPSHSLTYFLSTLTLVYLADRLDVPSMSKKYILEAIHERRLSVLLNIIGLLLISVSLLLSLSLLYIDLQIHYISRPYSEGWDRLWTDLITNATATDSCPVYRVATQTYYPVSAPVSHRATLFKSLLLFRTSHMKCVARLLRPNICLSPPHRRAYSLSGPHRTDYAYEMASANVRIGKGVTREVGKDLVNRGVKRVLLITDKNLMQHLPFSVTEQSLRAENIEFDVFSEVRVEPTDRSMKAAIHRAQLGQYDAFLAVGGGSVMDTAKVTRLFDVYPDKNFLDFVNKPIGGGEPVTRELKPLICIPTTSGTGSETSGVAIFQLEAIKAKTGFFYRALLPSLAIVDPLNALSMPKNVAIYCGLDVLCNCLESYTLIPYHTRVPLPSNPSERPAQQGSNPISDIWAVQVLKLVDEYFLRSVEGGGDEEASAQMNFASFLGGIGFGNAGVHLCHAISYAISGSVKDFSPDGYPSNPMIPHGLSVIVTAPAVFREVSRVAPDRCLQLAGLLGAAIHDVKTRDVGQCLSEVLCRIMHRLNVPNGLSALGFTTDDIPMLVEKTLPNTRLLNLSPIPTTSSHLEKILLESMILYR